MKFIKLVKNELFPKKPKKHKVSWVLDESAYLGLSEVNRLRKACIKAKAIALKKGKIVPVRDWFMVELGLFAGLRVREMADLKCGDLHINNEQSSLSVRKGKGGKPRTIRLKQEFKKQCLWFLEWKQKNGQGIDADDYLLTTDKGKQLTTRALQKAFKRCAKRAGLEAHYSIHCLRHTYGSHLYKAGKYNLRLVQEQLGHSSVRTTEVYASLMDADAKEAVEKLYKR